MWRLGRLSSTGPDVIRWQALMSATDSQSPQRHSGLARLRSDLFHTTLLRCRLIAFQGSRSLSRVGLLDQADVRMPTQADCGSVLYQAGCCNSGRKDGGLSGQVRVHGLEREPVERAAPVEEPTVIDWALLRNLSLVHG